MRRAAVAASFIAASLVAPLVVAASSHAQTVKPGRREVLLQATKAWNGDAYARYPAGTPQLTMLRVTIAAHTALPWHTHPVPNAGYVLSGQLTIQDRETGKSRTFQAGEAFAESVDDVHRGAAGDTPTVLILTYAGTPGLPTSKPVQGGDKEY